MQLQPIFSQEDTYTNQINQLYISSFPDDERKPIDHLYQHLMTGETSLYAILDASHFVGLVSLIHREDLSLIEYLAIDSSQQGKRYGSRTLQAIRELYPHQRFVIEIEDSTNILASNYIERKRRLQFYLQNDFKPLAIYYSFFGVDMELLATDEAVQFEEYVSCYTQLYGQLIEENIYLT